MNQGNHMKQGTVEQAQTAPPSWSLLRLVFQSSKSPTSDKIWKWSTFLLVFCIYVVYAVWAILAGKYFRFILKMTMLGVVNTVLTRGVSLLEYLVNGPDEKYNQQDESTSFDRDGSNISGYDSNSVSDSSGHQIDTNISIDSSHLKSPFLKCLANAMTVLCAVQEIMVFIFYWTVLAIPEYIRGKSVIGHTLNLLFHLLFPLISIATLLLERTSLKWRDFLRLTLPFFLVYIIILIIYAAVTGKGMYDPIFRFTNLITYIALAVGALMLVLSHWLAMLFSRLTEKRFLKKQAKSAKKAASASEGGFNQGFRPGAPGPDYQGKVYGYQPFRDDNIFSQ